MEAAREVYELPENHRWTARAGHKILVLDRGAVVLEFPRDWFVQPGREQTDIRDRATAGESTCVLAVSYLRLPPVDWSGLPLGELLLPAVQGDGREHIASGPTIAGRREARCRICLARGRGVQCLLSLDFWPEDETRLHAVWENVLDSLRLGVPVDDPTRGRRIE